MPQPRSKNDFLVINMSGSDEAEILLYGDIGDDYWADNNAAEMARRLNSLNVSTIKVRINSPGGSVWAAQAMYNSLKNHPASVTMYIDGIAASAATLVAMAGDKIIMPANSVMMVHNPMISAYGANRNDLEKLISLLDTARETMIAVYEAHTGQTRDKIIELLDAETYLTASEAKELGFADEVQDYRIAASIAGDKLIVGDCQLNRAAFAKLEAILGATEEKPASVEHQQHAAPAAISEGRDNPMALTVDQVRAESPETFAAIESAARAEGAKAERDRLQAIDSVALPGYEEMVAEAKANGTSAEALAVKLIAAEKDKSKVEAQNRTDDGKALADSLKGITAEEPDADAAEMSKLTAAFAQGAARRLPASK